MFESIAKRLFGSANDRFLKTLQEDVDIINGLEAEYEALSDADLRALTDKFRERLAAGETLAGIQNEAFATVREAAKRTLGQRHFDVQLIGGMIQNRGMISEGLGLEPDRLQAERSQFDTKRDALLGLYEDVTCDIGAEESLDYWSALLGSALTCR